MIIGWIQERERGVYYDLNRFTKDFDDEECNYLIFGVVRVAHVDGFSL